MRTATYRFVDGADVRTGTITLGRLVDVESWNHLFGPLAVHAPFEWACVGRAAWEAYSMRISAGVANAPDGAGGIRFDLLEFEFGIPVSTPELPGVAIRAIGTKLVIGGDGKRHAIPVGHAIRVRIVLGNGSACQVYERAASRGTRVLPSLTAKHPNSMRGDVGPWRALLRDGSGYDAKNTPLGERYGWLDPGIGGGFAIDFLPGYDGDVELALRRCDAMMNAAGLDVLGMFHGEVIDWRYQGVDGWWFGWLPEQQPASFLGAAGVEPNRDPRIHGPRWWNGGAPASYEAYSTGTVTYRDSQMANLEHLRRITGPLEAACEVWGDQLARIDRRILAQAMLAIFEKRIETWCEEAEGRYRGKGHPTLGGRGVAWLCDLLVMEPSTNAEGRKLARAIVQVQMANGLWNSKPFPTYGVPDPHVAGIEIKHPLRQTTNSSQGMEAVITAYVLARAGEVDSARLFLDRMFRTTVAWWGIGPLRKWATDACVFERNGKRWSKFLGVTDRGQVARRVTEWTDGTDYFGLVAAALGMFLSRDRDVFRRALLALPSPNGRPTKTTAEALRVFALPDELGREQTSLAASALETFG